MAKFVCLGFKKVKGKVCSGSGKKKRCKVKQIKRCKSFRKRGK